MQERSDIAIDGIKKCPYTNCKAIAKHHHLAEMENRFTYCEGDLNSFGGYKTCCDIGPLFSPTYKEFNKVQIKKRYLGSVRACNLMTIVYSSLTLFDTNDANLFKERYQTLFDKYDFVSDDDLLELRSYVEVVN